MGNDDKSCFPAENEKNSTIARIQHQKERLNPRALAPPHRGRGKQERRDRKRIAEDDGKVERQAPLLTHAESRVDLDVLAMKNDEMYSPSVLVIEREVPWHDDRGDQQRAEGIIISRIRGSSFPHEQVEGEREGGQRDRYRALRQRTKANRDVHPDEEQASMREYRSLNAEPSASAT